MVREEEVVADAGKVEEDKVVVAGKVVGGAVQGRQKTTMSAQEQSSRSPASLDLEMPLLPL
jgi:hypothetical protein